MKSRQISGRGVCEPGDWQDMGRMSCFPSPTSSRAFAAAVSLQGRHIPLGPQPPLLPRNNLPPPTQGEDPEYKWVLMVMKYWFLLFLGFICMGISITWILQIILYILISPPVSPFLNEMFIK